MTMALLFRHDVGFNFRYVIARVTGSPVHVALLFNGAIVIEADGSCVRQMTVAQRLQNGQWTTVVCNVGPSDAAKAYDYARAQIGKRYDWIGVLWAWWVGRVGKDGARDKFFCSELAAAALMAAGVSMEPTRAAAWTPRRLWNWCAPWRA